MEPQAFEKMRKKIYNKDKNIAGSYDLEETIGAGHFAQVKLAKHVFTGAKVAVKVIDKTKLDDIAKLHLHKEVSCMKLVQHPNVVRMYQVIDTQSKLYIILEYGDGGDLYDHIMTYYNKKGHGMTEEKARHYFKQIASAIDYCHKLHVVHRDLKPENVILFGNHDLAKLTDFGFSNVFVPEKQLDTSCGSLAYSAPEILLGDSYDPTAVDVWSLGVILYMMVCGRGPFNHASDSETLTNIIDCQYDLPTTLSNECKSLIKTMLVRNPSQRTSIKNILEDEWLCQGVTIDIPHNPLISKVKVSVDVHLNILQEMSSEWTKEQIENSLRDDQYGNITATYYLMAESKLKEKRRRRPKHSKIAARHSSPLDKKRSSTKKEEEEPLDYEDADAPDVVTTDLTSEHSLSDEHLNEVTNNNTGDQEFVAKPLASRAKRMSYPFPSRVKSQSSPNLPSISEPITEEDSEFDDSPRNSPHLSKKPPNRRTRTSISTACRLSPIHSRRSSYSSSDDDDSHLKLEKRILSHSSQPSNVTSGNNTPQSDSTLPDNSSSNRKSRAASTENLNAKMLSLILDDLSEQISSKSSPKVMLANLVNNAYGRHLSDTNLTTYSMQLQLALATEKLKSFSSTHQHHHHHQSKSNSDSNLVKKFHKKKHHIVPADIFKTKEMIFKYLKRTRSGNKSASPISLSAPIEEEDPIINTGGPLAESVNTCSLSETFSDIQEHELTSDAETNECTQSCVQQRETNSSVKYYLDAASEVVDEWSKIESKDNEVQQQNDKGTTRNTTPKSIMNTIPGSKTYAPLVTANGSVCCSLI